jgi:hypothetical protein
MSLLLLAASLFTFGSCVDSDYDLSKDIDSTLGLGHEGLTLKLGSTDKVFMKDLLEVDNSNMLDTTATGIYYLIKDGTAKATTQLANTDPVNISPVVIQKTTDFIVIQNGKALEGDVSQLQDFDVTINNVDEDILEMRTVVPKSSFRLTGRLTTSVPNVSIQMRNMVITLPSWIRSHDLNNNNQLVLNGSTDNFSISIDSLVLPKSSGALYGAKNNNGKIQISTQASASGTVILTANGSGTYTTRRNAQVTITLNFASMQPQTVSGVVSRTISPDVDDIVIGNDLPDFLQADEVRIEASNPTLKLWTRNGGAWPLNLRLSGQLISEKGSQEIARVTIPSTGYATIASNEDRYYYFSADDTPFAPDGISSPYDFYKVGNLNDVFQTIPDRIAVDMSGGKTTTDPTQLVRVSLGSTYTFNLSYEALVPFAFNANTIIVYTDSATEMHDDLDKISADGLQATGDIINTLPMKLKVEVIPYGVNGRSLTDVIKVTTDTVAPGTLENPVTTPVSVSMTCTDPKAVQQLDKFVFRVTGASEATGTVLSTQYIKLENIRLRLTGQVTYDAN